MEKDRNLPSPIAEDDDDEEVRGSDVGSGGGDDDDDVGEMEDSISLMRHQEQQFRPHSTVATAAEMSSSQEDIFRRQSLPAQTQSSVPAAVRRALMSHPNQPASAASVHDSSSAAAIRRASTPLGLATAAAASAAPGAGLPPSEPSTNPRRGSATGSYGLPVPPDWARAKSIYFDQRRGSRGRDAVAAVIAEMNLRRSPSPTPAAASAPQHQQQRPSSLALAQPQRLADGKQVFFPERQQQPLSSHATSPLLSSEASSTLVTADLLSSDHNHFSSPSPVKPQFTRLESRPPPSALIQEPEQETFEGSIGWKILKFFHLSADPEGPGCCALLLALVSVLLIIATLPFSLCMCIKVVQEYERSVIFRLGRLRKGGAKGPGIFFIIPCIDTYRKVDLRTVSFDVPPQEVLSRDSVTVTVDAVVYYRVSNPTMATNNVEDFSHSTHLLAATTLRNVLGTKHLAEILSERETISHVMEQTLDEATDPWGVKVERVEIKDVRLPVQLQRAMAAEAEAAREARAKVIAAEGEQKASRALREASEVISESPSALQLRYLQTLNTISAEKNSTIIFPVPMDIISHFFQGKKHD